MPVKNGTCLNEEYTNVVKKIHESLKEAKELFDSIPKCLQNVETEHQRLGGNSLEWYLFNGEKCAWLFAKEFGIEVER